MNNAQLALIGADAILVLHVLFVLFVVLSVPLIFVGSACAWSWVRNPWFRLVHLVSILVVVIQSWLGIICPLTVWEMQLRAYAEQATYQGTFISYWLSELLYYDAPAWVFMAVYTTFGLLVGMSWYWVKPRWFK